jgi:uncharacterized protein YjbJ (UPF0337 family)
MPTSLSAAFDHGPSAAPTDRKTVPTHHADAAEIRAAKIQCSFPFSQSGEAMNWDRIEGNWKQLQGKLREQWGRLTDDEFVEIAGKRDKLAGRLQNSYGIAKDEAEKQIKDFEDQVERNKWVQ